MNGFAGMNNAEQDYWAYWEKCISLFEKAGPEKAFEYAKDIAKRLHVPDALINRILAVNLSAYSAKIDGLMEECIRRAKDEKAKALCLYYDMDSGWESTMYICKDFSKKSNSWIGASRSWIDIDKARGLSGIYKKEADSAFLADDTSTGICILLMLKTALAFKVTADKYGDCGLHICITCTESDFIRLTQP